MKNSSLKEVGEISELNWNNSDKDNRILCIENALALCNCREWKKAIFWANIGIETYSIGIEENTMCDLARLYAIKGYCCHFLDSQEESKEYYLKSTEYHFKAYNTNVHKDKEFYKFFSVDERNIDSVINSIRLIHPSLFNDPMDAPILCNKDNGVPYIDIFNGIRIGCFGEVKDELFYLNPRKWSFYGDSHKGICICYDFSGIEVTDEYFLMRKVKYESQYEPNRGLVGGLLSKSKVYEEEDEWRIIIHDRELTSLDSHKFIPINLSMIRKIYFGYKCDQKIQEKIYKELSNEENIELFKVFPSFENFYELTCRPFGID